MTHFLKRLYVSLSNLDNICPIEWRDYRTFGSVALRRRCAACDDCSAKWFQKIL